MAIEAALCGATKKDGSGKTCQNVAGFGTNHVGAGKCRVHGGNTPSHALHGARVLTDMKLRRELAQMAVPLDGNVDPQALLLHLVREAAGNVAYLGARVQELSETTDESQRDEDARNSEWGRRTAYSRGAYLFGPTIAVDKDGGEHIVGEDQRGMVKLYGEWSDRLAKYCKLALDAGIAKAQVELAQSQGQSITMIVNQAMIFVGMSEQQMEAARAFIAAEFRKLAGGPDGA